MNDDSQRIAATVKQVVLWLVAGEFHAVEEFSGGIRLSSDQLRDAVADYGHKLVIPPLAAFEQIDAIEVTNSKPKKWSVRFDMWTIDEGRSDLTLECTIIDNLKETGRDATLMTVEVDGLHVL